MIHNLELHIGEDEKLHIIVDLRAPSKLSRRADRTGNVVISSSGGSLRLVGPDGRYRAETLNMSVFRAYDRERDGDMAPPRRPF